jgi:hypothetical protein
MIVSSAEQQRARPIMMVGVLFDGHEIVKDEQRFYHLFSQQKGIKTLFLLPRVVLLLLFFL